MPEARFQYDQAVLDVAQRTEHGKRHREALQGVGLWLPQGRVLDVGCGSGLLLATLGADARLRVGCDFRRNLYVQAKPELSGSVLFVQSDAARLPFPDGCFDLVTCLAVIGELPNWRAALSEMARCVAPGGALYLTVANSPLLVRLYNVVERLGHRVRADHWQYARASLSLFDSPPEHGFDVPALVGWRHFDITAPLARSAYPWLCAVPRRLLAPLVRRIAPSFGFAWQRPAEQRHLRL